MGVLKDISAHLKSATGRGKSHNKPEAKNIEAMQVVPLISDISRGLSHHYVYSEY